MPVVGMQPSRQSGDTVMRAGIGTSVRPFPQSALDEALGFAIGSRCVGSGMTPCSQAAQYAKAKILFPRFVPSCVFPLPRRRRTVRPRSRMLMEERSRRHPLDSSTAPARWRNYRQRTPRHSHRQTRAPPGCRECPTKHWIRFPGPPADLPGVVIDPRSSPQAGSPRVVLNPPPIHSLPSGYCELTVLK